ncbi:MAG: RDD family protein [Blastocatellia bacterium]|nr:RDD family protein [Blastocatellia bacterium]
MICAKCGKEYAEKSTFCPYCGYKMSRDSVKESPQVALENSNVRAETLRSTLIEFPKLTDKQRTQAKSTPSSSDWRAELSERVRQVKERRNLQQARGRLQAELEAATQRYQQANSQPVQSGQAVQLTLSNPSTNEEKVSDKEDRTVNPVIEAALKRARRASETAARGMTGQAATAPKMPPQVQTAPKAKATAAFAALPVQQPVAVISQPETLPEEKVEEKVFAVASESTELSSKLPIKSLTAATNTAKTEAVPTSTIASQVSTETLSTALFDESFEMGEEWLAMQEGVGVQEGVGAEEKAFQEEADLGVASEPVVSRSDTGKATRVVEQVEEVEEKRTNQATRPVRIIKESDSAPNYLDELIKVCDQETSSQPAAFSQRFFSSLIDLAIVAAFSAPFWFVTPYTGADITSPHTTKLLIASTITVILTYITLSSWASARTLGMIFVGTKLVSSANGAHPTLIQSILRSLGYVLSTLLAGVGFLWIFVSREKRGLHDIVSGTTVVREY